MTSDSFDMSDGLLIDCSACPHRGRSECEDCLVAYLLDRPEGAVIFDVAEERALRALREGGLLPDVRFGRETG
jgi:hypothetical protein